MKVLKIDSKCFPSLGGGFDSRIPLKFTKPFKSITYALFPLFSGLIQGLIFTRKTINFTAQIRRNVSIL